MPRLARIALCLLLPGALAGEAAAHAILVKSRPEAGTTVVPGDVAMEFRFNSRIDRARSRLVLSGPDGASRALTIADEASPEVLRTTAVALAPGAYAVRWQVLAVDGHITRGEVRFTVGGR